MAQLNDLFVKGSSCFLNGININGAVTATEFSGSGASLTSLNASNLSSGTVAIGRLPTGTTSTTVSLGNHTHTYLALAYSSSRPTSANLTTSANGLGTMFHFLATSSMTEGKPPVDSNILHFDWDNNGGWDVQLAVGRGGLYYRGQSSGTWQDWKTVLHNENYTTYCTPSNIGAATTDHTHSTYLPLAGGKLTGALTFANGTLNTVGDDVAIGDVNSAGLLGIKGITGVTGLLLIPKGSSSNTTGQTLRSDGSILTVSGTISSTFSGDLSGTATKVSNSLSINGKTYDGSSAIDAGTLGVSYGGTGQTTLNAAANSFINSLTTGTAAPVDADYFISQSVNGGTTTTSYVRRPVSSLWSYMADKIGSAGSATKLTYISSGVAKASDTTVGSTDTPVYLNDGTITTTGKKFSDYTPLTGTGASGTWGISITGNAATATKAGTSWTVTTTIGEWSRICFLSGGYANYLLTCQFSQAYQVVENTFLIGVGYNSGLITQVGACGYVSNSDFSIRLVKNNDTSCYVEVYSKFSYNSATTVKINCHLISIGTANLTVTKYTDYTATVSSPTVWHTLDSKYNGMVSNKFYGALVGNADTSTKLETARTLTIGKYAKSFDGSANVSWTLDDIGAAAASHTHSYIPLSGSTAITGNLAMNSSGLGYWLKDKTGAVYAGIHDNTTNLWIGAASGASTHHTGETYISTGYNSTTKAGNSSILISVPSYNSDTSTWSNTNYWALHSGNYKTYAATVDHTHNYLLPFVAGTQTSSTGAWTGTSSEISKLYNGLTIIYWLPYAGSGNATLNLTLKDGSTTGAINCYYSSTSRLTTHVGANNTMVLTYQTVTISGTSYTGWWLNKAYYADTVHMLRNENGRVYAGTNGIWNYTLIALDSNGQFQSFVTSSGTGTSKGINTTAKFKIPAVIYYYGGNNSATVGNLVSSTYAIYSKVASLDLRYSTNCTTTAFTGNSPIYLEGTLDSNNYFSPTTNCITQTLTAGYYYIYLGQTYSTVYQLSLSADHPCYYYDGTNLKDYTTNHTHSDYMPITGNILTGPDSVSTICLGSTYSGSGATRYSNITSTYSNIKSKVYQITSASNDNDGQLEITHSYDGLSLSFDSDDYNNTTLTSKKISIRGVYGSGNAEQEAYIQFNTGAPPVLTIYPAGGYVSISKSIQGSIYFDSYSSGVSITGASNSTSLTLTCASTSIAMTSTTMTLTAPTSITLSGKVINAYAYSNSVSGSPLYVSSAGQIGKSSSSRRTKTNINYNVDKEQYHSVLMNLKTVEFEYKNNLGVTELGMIAEDVEELSPIATYYEYEPIYDDNNQAIGEKPTGRVDNYKDRAITQMLVMESQRKDKEIESLKNEVEQLKELVNKLLDKEK